MSDCGLVKVRRIRGKKLPLTAAGLQVLRDEYTRTIAPVRALAAEALTLKGRSNRMSYFHQTLFAPSERANC
jgi:hypothetical protein